MASYRRSEIVSGLFVVLAAVVFGLFAFKVGRFDLMGLLKDDAVTCRTYFANVKTLQVGSKVRVGGREVGEITNLVLVEGPTPLTKQEPAALNRLVNEVTFELTYPQLRLDPETARVHLAQESLLAPHFLELDPGRWRGSRPPATLFEAELPPVVIIASEAGVGIDELMAQARPVLNDLGALIHTVNQRLLTDGNVEAINRVISELDAAIGEGRQLVTHLNRDLLAPENVAALERTVHNLDAAVADGRSAAGRIDALLDAEQDPRLDNLLTELGTTTRELRADLDAISTDLRRLLGDTDRVVGQAETELAEVSRRLRRTLWQGEMALRKIRANPSLVFFGDDETDLEARDLDLTEIRLRGRARPYEQRDERNDEN
jgi:ABC-type transporter Mla subunit MlaD